MITTIMTGFERPQNLQRQLDAILGQTIPIVKDDIMVWYNKGTSPQQPPPGIKTIMCNYNAKFHGRFALALLAKTEYVAIFDDDTIPGKRWFENCLNTMKTHPGILGTVGLILRKKSYYGYSRIGWSGARLDQVKQVDLVGHAWFFKKEYLKYLWYEEPISWESGEDIQFSYLAQKYGQIKTYVPPHPKSNGELWGSIDGTALGNDSVATYIINGSAHLLERDRCVITAIKNGWKTVEMRNEDT